MTRYSVQPTDRVFVEGYGFLSFTINTGINISKTVSSKYCRKILDHAKQSATDTLKNALKRAKQKTAKAAGTLTRDKIADKITRVSKLHYRITQK